MILVAILMFAVLIETAGLLAATFIAVVVLSAFAPRAKRTGSRRSALAVVSPLFCVVVFVYGLEQPIPMSRGG